ncbi:SOS response-associated peptidase [Microbacterium sp. AR7-10]|uniref:SOS response-associated peptidase n=1 Tax=Microbacterium sp. AR7-10 TaxID=1891970 RepID=UPI0008FC7648|nr:SOS response-associated peptidase [Microbacterium sp. AR7-10]
MCGRSAMDANTDELISEFVAQGCKPEDWWKEWHGSYSIAPTDQAPIVRDRGEGRILELVRWDWQKPPSRPTGAPIINARIEKLATGFWTPAFTAARCVVPMRGYYEWTGTKGDKTPHFLHREDDSLLAAAGLTWSMDVKGEHVRCFVVVTREARDAGGEVHDRMPAFLTPDAMDAWLESVKLDRTGREEMLAALDGSSTAIASTIRQHVVDRRVNSVRAADPSDPGLIAPAVQ